MSYRNDPRWQAAQEAFVADKRADESAGGALVRRRFAIDQMYSIEVEYEQRARLAALLSPGAGEAAA